GQSKSEFEPEGVLCGFVTDAGTGDPVTDARISISMRRIYRTEADANGFYSFDEVGQDGNYKIEVTSKDYIGITDYRSLPVVSLEKGKQVVRNFELARACQIEVRVIDEAGKPIEGARIRVSSLADAMGREFGSNRYSKQTDEEGLILLGGFEPAETGYVITAMGTHLGDSIKRGGHGYRRTIYDYAPDRLVVTFTDPNLIEYGEIVLKKGVQVQGYAEYADGVPAEGLEISARPDWWHCTTVPEMAPIDANGLFTLTHIVPGAYSLNIHFPRDGGGSTSFPVLQAQLPMEDGVLSVKIPRRSPGSSVSISGEVTFAGSEKPDHVEVSAYSPEDGGHHSVSLLGGQRTFTLGSLGPGTYTVSFSGPNVERKVVENVEAPCTDLQVELTYVAKPKLRGSVVRAGTDEPVTKFRARLRKVKALRGIYYTQSSAWNEFDNPRGTFDIQAVGPGVYEVQVAADGFAWIWSERVNTDQNKPVRIELVQGGAIEGTVLDAERNPISGARVIPLSKAAGTSRQLSEEFVSEEGAVETDSSGKFRLENLAPRRESIKVKHADFAFSVAKGIEVLDGRATKGIEVVLSKGGGAEGYVYDVRGKPQGGVTLLFEAEPGYSGEAELAGRLATVITDSNG
ncbi:MAG: carboxypeptidase regulatory-like domain-containing protein, partial [Phycisphaerales bacterium]